MQLIDVKVLRHAHVAERDRFLMDCRNAVLFGICRRPDMDGCAVDANLALVNADHAGECVHQRRFARTVDADQAEHLAAERLYRDVLKRLYAGERLADIPDIQICLFFHPCSLLSAWNGSHPSR